MYRRFRRHVSGPGRRAALAAAACLLAAAAPARALTVSGVVARVTAGAYAAAHTNLFVANGQNRGFTGDPNAAVHRVPALQHDPARDRIRAAFAEAGWQTELDPFWFQRAFGSVTYTYTNCHNVVAVKRGTDPASHGIWVIGAHYDSVDPGQLSQLSPGADDNASGVAGVLEAARVLGELTFRGTLVLVAFDAEEKGLHGAQHFVEDSTSADAGDTNRFYRGDIRGMVSLDMIAYNPAGAGHDMAYVYGGGSSGATPARTGLAAAVQRYGGLAAVNSGAANYSDHTPFYGAGIDACLLIEYHVWDNPHYHRTTDSADTPGYLDYDYAARLTRGVVGFLCEQACVVPPAELVRAEPAGAAAWALAWESRPGLVHELQAAVELRGTNAWEAVGVYTNTAGSDIMCVTVTVEQARAHFRVQSR